MMAAAAAAAVAPLSQSNKSEANKIVAIVTPETGFWDEPTRPAIYPATAENRNPATTMTSVMARPTPTLPTIDWYSRKIGMTSSAIPIST